MTALLVSINSSVFFDFRSKQTKGKAGFIFNTCDNFYPSPRSNFRLFLRKNHKFETSSHRTSFWGPTETQKTKILIKKLKRKEILVVQANRNFNGGGGGKDDGTTSRIVGNLALAIGLTYLSMTGQLGWILDAIVSIWLFVVIVPILGLGAFLWYAGREIIQDSCPNCGNEFQILKSSLKDGQQLCPFCTQPFSVQGNKFARASAKFSSNQSSTTFGQAFNDFSPRSEKGKGPSIDIVDIEAEVKDVD